MAHSGQIKLFLVNFKKAIKEDRLIVINREKNNNFIAQYGITPKERENVLYSLEVTDYQNGPVEDYDRPGEKNIWEFTKEYMGIKIYIKIKLIATEDGFYAKCISFHD